MKLLIITVSLLSTISLSTIETKKTLENSESVERVVGSSFSLINDTKSKVSIYTGTGFVSLNKGSKTSIGCNTGKEVRWADSGRKGAVIFKITSSMCGKTLKLSDLID